VTVHPTPAAPDVEDVEYCLGDDTSELTAIPEGANELNWYTDIAGDNPIPAPVPDASAVNAFIYYVSQTTSEGCEGPLAPVTVTIHDLPAPPVVQDIEYCLNDVSSPLTAAAVGTLTWYSDAGVTVIPTPTPNTSVPNINTYYVSQTDGNSCESELAELKVIVYDIPDVVTMNGTEVDFCFGQQIDLDFTNVLTADEVFYVFEDAAMIVPASPATSTGNWISDNTYETDQQLWVIIRNTLTTCESHTTLEVTATVNRLDTDGDGLTDCEETTAIDDLFSLAVSTAVSDENDPCDPITTIGSTFYDVDNVIWAAGDCDGDGVLNGVEVSGNTDPFDSCDYDYVQITEPITAVKDCDGDGVLDAQEVVDGTHPLEPCSYEVASITEAIVSGEDCDEDGALDATEVANGTDSFDACSYNVADVTEPVTSGEDCDGDGVLDATEIVDNTDPFDPCDLVVENVTEENSGIWLTEDCDGDGVINQDELDGDTDPYSECSYLVEAITRPITSGADCDEDGVLDAAEVVDATVPFDSCSYNEVSITEPITSDVDCDGDGVIEANEVADGTDQTAPCSYVQDSITKDITSGVDCDGDGVIELYEITNETSVTDFCDFNPEDVTLAPKQIWLDDDCDTDTILNGEEMTIGSYLDTDEDGLYNYEDADDDGDGVDTQYEYYDFANSTYDTFLDPFNQDTDGDGIPDYLDADDDGDGHLTIIEGANTDGDNNPMTGNTRDLDGDSVPDYLEPNTVIGDGEAPFVFNGLSPNGDGENDTFIIQGIDKMSSNVLSIFNRWGVKVYEEVDYGMNDNFFDGRSERSLTVGSDQVLPSGTYFYVIKYVIDNEFFEKQGYIYIK